MRVVSADTSATLEIHGSRIVESQLSDEQTITLALKQYSNPLMAGLREAAATNAADACIRAGRLDANIEVTLTETADKKGTIVVIRDYGCGMSREFLENNYFALGHTTAKGDERLSGGFGLGSKALLAIADMIAVTTIQNGQAHSAIGQLIDNRIRVSAVRSVDTVKPDGTELTAPLPNSDINTVADTLRTIAVYVGTGSDFRGSIVLTVNTGKRSGCDREVLWSLQSNRGACVADYYGNSMIVVRKNVYDSQWSQSAREMTLGGSRVLLGVPENVASSLKSGTVWNNAKYEVSYNLCKRVTDELASRGVNIDVAKLLSSDAVSIASFAVCESSTTLVTTSDRSSLRDEEINVISIADKVQSIQREYFDNYYRRVKGLLDELNNRSNCFQSKFDELILLARSMHNGLSHVGLTGNTADKQLANIAIPLAGDINPMLRDMSGYSDLIYFLSHSLSYHHNINAVGTTHYSNRKYGSSSHGWKSVTQFNPESSREHDYHGRLKVLSGYNNYTTRTTGLRQGVWIQRVIVIASRSEKGGKQSLSVLRKALQSSVEECLFAVIYVLPTSVESTREILVKQLKLLSLDIDVMTVSEYATSLGETNPDRSTIATSSRMIKHQLFVYDLDESKRSRVDDITDEGLLIRELRKNIEKDYPGKLSVYRMLSDGESILDDRGYPTKVTLATMTNLLRVVGVCAVGVGTEATDKELCASVVTLSKQDLQRRFWELVKMSRYFGVYNASKRLMGFFGLDLHETRDRLPDPPPYYRFLRGNLQRSIQLVLGNEYRVRDLPIWSELKMYRRLMSKYQSDVHCHRRKRFFAMLDSNRRHGDLERRRLELHGGIQVIMGDNTERFLRRYIPESFLVRRLNRLSETLAQYTRVLDRQLTCAHLPYSSNGTAISSQDDSWDSTSRYLGDAVQSTIMRQGLRELWRLLSTFK